jgi:hypothetical protein
MLETLGFLAFVFAILFVALMSPKRTQVPPKPAPKAPAQAADENKKDSDSAQQDGKDH